MTDENPDTAPADRQARGPALEALDIFVGEWSMEVVFPKDPTNVLRGGRSVFEWLKTGHLLVQRTEVPVPEAPDAISIVAYDPGKDGYTLHYFDSRGVVRLCAMTFLDGVWTLLRTTRDFSPLDFAQRYIGEFTDGGDAIRGAWEWSKDGSSWEIDFNLTYKRVKPARRTGRASKATTL